MQRVLSLQTARGFGESSEFVTKRICFSFLFSVGFLCLLCGFLLGRFAFEKSNELRAERIRLELAGNGLENTEYLRRLMIQKVTEVVYDGEEYAWTTSSSEEQKNATWGDIVHTFSNLTFVHRIIGGDSSIVVMSRGFREPDRYVILAAGGERIPIALELARIFDHLRSEYGWKSRRSLVFCVFLGSSDVCTNVLSSFLRHRVVTYIALYDGHDDLQGTGKIVSSASDIVRSIVFQEEDVDRGLTGSDNRQIFNYRDFSYPRPALGIPHLVFSIVKESDSGHSEDKQRNSNFNSYTVALARLVGDAIWKLSESLALRWDLKVFDDIINRTLEVIEISAIVTNAKDEFKQVLSKLVSDLRILNKRVDATESNKSLDIRILNDLLIDLDKVLLCSDEHYQSKTDLAQLSILLKESLNVNELMKCYKMALQMLQE